MNNKQENSSRIFIVLYNENQTVRLNAPLTSASFYSFKNFHSFFDRTTYHKYSIYSLYHADASLRQQTDC